MWIPVRAGKRWRIEAPPNTPERRVLAYVSEARLIAMLAYGEGCLKDSGTAQPEGSSPTERASMQGKLKGAPLTV